MATKKFLDKLAAQKCAKKKKHTFEGAKITLKKIEQVKGKTTLNVYQCSNCKAYHLGNNYGKIR